MQANATFFDGETAEQHEVTVYLNGHGGLVFQGEDVAVKDWRFSDLVAVESNRPGSPFRVSHRKYPGARLVIPDRIFATTLIDKAPQLEGRIPRSHAAKVLLWIAGGFAFLVLAAWATLQYAPERLAFLLPESWLERAGTQFEASLTKGAALCEKADSKAAFSAIVARIAEGSPGIPPVTISVYKIPIMNAFALPGGRIVVTSTLIAKAETPEELAGVLAHELGHVVNRHSEAQIIRATGLELLIAIATGGSGNDMLSSIAGLAAILRYSRAAEAEADAFAIQTLQNAAIDPMGLKHFFELVLAEQGKSPEGTFGKIEGAFATHPGTEERIKAIHPLPAGITARPVIDGTQWLALKNICS
ncbi:MAG TPA: M48 family metallopeptidase [Aestuariivirga sp.]|nr:M48 family metallopeptidase [Aestuariivirga sp.]